MPSKRRYGRSMSRRRILPNTIKSTWSFPDYSTLRSVELIVNRSISKVLAECNQDNAAGAKVLQEQAEWRWLDPANPASYMSRIANTKLPPFDPTIPTLMAFDRDQLECQNRKLTGCFNNELNKRAALRRHYGQLKRTHDDDARCLEEMRESVLRQSAEGQEALTVARQELRLPAKSNPPKFKLMPSSELDPSLDPNKGQLFR